MTTDLERLIKPQETLADELGMSYSDLARLVYPTTQPLYKTFGITKKSGGHRIIRAPKKELLEIQRKIAKLLSKKYKPRNSAHGFIKGRSIITNAQPHVNKAFVFNIDLENFFGAIHFGRIRNLLKSHPFSYDHVSATIIAHICCYNGSLPQGAPTSPMIANMICWKLDRELQDLAKRHGCSYTRYADDITFSFSVPKTRLPPSIVKSEDANVAAPGAELEQLIEKNGFSINYSKVRLRSRVDRQEVTGLVVNKKINVNRTFIRQTFSMLHAWKKHGSEAAGQEYLAKYRTRELTSWQKENTLSRKGRFFETVVRGRINYIKGVRGASDPIVRKLAYQLSVALDDPDPSLLDLPCHDAMHSVFVISNLITMGQGTGFLLKNVGLVTNQHVIEGIDPSNEECLEVHRHDKPDQIFRTRVKGMRRDPDLAILEIPTELQDAPQLSTKTRATCKIGDEVAIIGFPGWGPGSTTAILRTSITQTRRFHKTPVFVVDRPIHHGMSGSPVLDNSGDVVGVATYGPERPGVDDVYLNGFISIAELEKLTTVD